MFKSFTKLVLFSVLIVAGCSKDDDNAANSSFSITSISPTSGMEGDLVTISGKGFAADFTQNVVMFNGVPGVVQ